MRKTLLLMSPLPAVIVGTLVMRESGVATGTWLQHLGAGLALVALAGIPGVTPRWRRVPGAASGEVVTLLALLLLAATLAQAGIEGVRRWVPLGPLQWHAAFIVLPMLLVALDAVIRRSPRRAWVVPLATMLAATVLALQPDPSQATAWGVGVLVLLVVRRAPTVADTLTAAIALLAAVVAWTRPDPLTAVPHVEGIVGLAAGLGSLWVVASLVALALLPVPFLADAVRTPHGGRASLAIAAYIATVCIAPLLGPYPVPVLGFGLSPLVGYCAVLVWHTAAADAQPAGQP